MEAVTGSRPDIAQLPLAATVKSIHLEGARRIRALARKAMAENGITLGSLAYETGRDEAQLSRMLADDGGAHLAPDVISAILSRDARRIFICGLCALCGMEAVEHRPNPEEEVRKLRKGLRSAIEALSVALGDIS